MTNKNKIYKITAIAGTFAAIAAAIAALLTHSKKKSQNLQANEETVTDDHDISDLDIASIDNDTPRQYVSISINEHADGKNVENDSQI